MSNSPRGDLPHHENDDFVAPGICKQCGAAAYPQQVFCWLCGTRMSAAEVNPYRPPTAERTSPEKTDWFDVLDTAVFGVIFLFVLAAAFGLVSNGEHGQGLAIGAGFVPWSIGYLYVRSRQRISKRKDFWGSRTFAAITGVAAALGVAVLLAIAFYILLIVICFGGFRGAF